MRYLFLLATIFVQASPVRASGLKLRVLRYDNLVAIGAPLQCDLETKGFGFLIKQVSETDYEVETISNGKSEGDASKLTFKAKEYGPFHLYISNHRRTDDFATYTEFLIEKKMNGVGRFNGHIMFTEAYYSKSEEGKEVEELKPIAKQKLSCLPMGKM